jgi:hypothetical protein
MSDREMMEMAFSAVEVHQCSDEGRRRMAIRSFLGGSFTCWEMKPATAWNDDYWEKVGNCHTTLEARDWVGRL